MAAAFINFITDSAAASVVIHNGDLPAADPGSSAIDPNSSLAAISAAWLEKSQAGTLTPYLDWATATMGDTLFGGLQQLTSGR